MSHPQLIVALDTDDLDAALTLVDRAGPEVGWYKVGKQLFTRQGPPAVRELAARGKKVFLDLKFHDIPNTVAQAVSAAADLGATMVNVHAGGGSAMMRAAAEAIADRPEVLLIAVTVLTSLDEAALHEVGVATSPAVQARRLALLARDAGLHGVVCSAHELADIGAACGPEFLTVVPGIRPAGSALGDQKRVMTPADAVRAGAAYLVVGRPITAATDPAAAARALANEIAEVSK